MTGNDIATHQNQPDMIRCLAAQRQLYSEEKRWKMIWYGVATVVALAATGLLPATNNFLPQVTALTIIFAVLELVVLPLISRQRTKAASIQELFDCDLLHLGWNEVLVNKPEQHEIDEAVDRFNKQPKREEAYAKLKDWYGGVTTDTPLSQARVICQKMNLGWDEDVRREWQMWLYVGLSAAGLLSLLLGLFRQWPITAYFTGPFLLLIPLALGALKSAWDQNTVRRRLEELNRQCDQLLREVTHVDTDATAILQQSRQLQDEIYRHRSTDATVPDFIYERVRRRRERHLAERTAEK